MTDDIAGLVERLRESARKQRAALELFRESDEKRVVLREIEILEQAANKLDRQKEIASVVFGWVWAEVCARADKGERIQDVEIPEVYEAMKESLGLD